MIDSRLSEVSWWRRKDEIIVVGIAKTSLTQWGNLGVSYRRVPEFSAIKNSLFPRHQVFYFLTADESIVYELR